MTTIPILSKSVIEPIRQANNRGIFGIGLDAVANHSADNGTLTAAFKNLQDKAGNLVFAANSQEPNSIMISKFFLDLIHIAEPLKQLYAWAQQLCSDKVIKDLDLDGDQRSVANKLHEKIGSFLSPQESA